ncbi:MAG: TonB family protein [Zetaproteobacteria bacterium]|nr:MAG: TonB family protein [Zetaproteobacteria bacterium]
MKRKPPAHDPASLTTGDITVAIVLHILVATILISLNLWYPVHRPEPLKRIEVSMISAADLARMQQAARSKPKTSKAKPLTSITPAPSKPKPEPAKREKPAPLPSPQPKPQRKAKTSTKSKPEPKPAPKPKPKSSLPVPGSKKRKKQEPAFDPFAPIESKSDVHKKPKSSSPQLANMISKQLSKQELDRYVAMMQAAVQKHWKVPANMKVERHPLVEVHLHPDGSIESIRILESSGNPAMDDSLILAIRKAAPFTLPKAQFEAFRVNRIRFHPLD